MVERFKKYIFLGLKDWSQQTCRYNDAALWIERFGNTKKVSIVCHRICHCRLTDSRDQTILNQHVLFLHEPGGKVSADLVKTVVREGCYAIRVLEAESGIALSRVVKEE